MDSMVEENGGNSSIDPLSGVGNGTGEDNHEHIPRRNPKLPFLADNNNSGGGQGQQQQQQNNSSEFPANILTAQSPGLTVLKNSPQNIVHLIAHPSQSSVIQSSVIQSANHIPPMMHSSKGGFGGPPQGTTVYVQKSNSVIQAPGIRVSEIISNVNQGGFCFPLFTKCICFIFSRI